MDKLDRAANLKVKLIAGKIIPAIATTTEQKIRGKYEQGGLKVRIIGFAKAISDIAIGGRVVNRVEPADRDIARVHPELDLFHPWAINSEEAAKIALQCEAAAMKTSRRITNSDGAAVSAQQSHFFSAHTHGFRGGYASSRHSISVAPIAKLPGRNAEMQRDAWYTSMRCADEMASPEAVGRYAAERALSRLGARKIATTECPVLFESPVAAGLLGGFVQAVSGGALYRKSSFLLDSLGKKVFPKHIDIEEDPHLLRGKGSSPFDDEGVRSVRRHVVKGGRVEGYFLSSYSARKLGMKTTGNAGDRKSVV